MDLRQFAIRILSADTLEEKLFSPEELSDVDPGPPLVWKEPVRPPGMGFCKHTRKDRLPRLKEHGSADKRAICLHRFAGHELLAVEIMAFALLAFPEAPRAFRRSVAHTLQEEQEHVRLYLRRLKSFGVAFGDMPLYRHFWSYVPYITSPMKYISLMSLTFEMANLDFAPIYGASFAAHGDAESAALMARILHDEIGHVSLGCRFLHKWKDPQESGYDTWLQNIPPQMEPSRARGALFFEENRKKAGVPEDWIQALQRGL